MLARTSELGFRTLRMLLFVRRRRLVKFPHREAHEAREEPQCGVPRKQMPRVWERIACK